MEKFQIKKDYSEESIDFTIKDIKNYKKTEELWTLLCNNKGFLYFCNNKTGKILYTYPVNTNFFNDWFFFNGIWKNKTNGLIQKVNPDSTTYFHEAAFIGNIAVIKLYIDHNGDINVTDNKGRNALHLSCISNNKQISKILLMNNINKDQYDTINLNSPLMYCIQYKSYDCLKLLVYHNCNINIKDKIGNTPMHYAVKAKNLKLILYILKKGGTLKEKNIFSKYPIDIAIENNDWDIVNYLMKLKNTINLSKKEDLIVNEIINEKEKNNEEEKILNESKINKMYNTFEKSNKFESKLKSNKEIINELKDQIQKEENQINSSKFSGDYQSDIWDVFGEKILNFRKFIRSLELRKYLYFLYQSAEEKILFFKNGFSKLKIYINDDIEEVNNNLNYKFSKSFLQNETINLNKGNENGHFNNLIISYRGDLLDIGKIPKTINLINNNGGKNEDKSSKKFWKNNIKKSKSHIYFINKISEKKKFNKYLKRLKTFYSRVVKREKIITRKNKDYIENSRYKSSILNLFSKSLLYINEKESIFNNIEISENYWDNFSINKQLYENGIEIKNSLLIERELIENSDNKIINLLNEYNQSLKKDLNIINNNKKISSKSMNLENFKESSSDIISNNRSI